MIKQTVYHAENFKTPFDNKFLLKKIIKLAGKLIFTRSKFSDKVIFDTFYMQDKKSNTVY